MKPRVLAIGHGLSLESLIVALFCIWIMSRTAHSAGMLVTNYTQAQ